MKHSHMSSQITRDDEVLSGTPVFTGTRVPVQTLIDYRAAGQPLLESYLHHLAGDRPRTVSETSHYGYIQSLLSAAGAQGEPTLDIYLNETTFWRNVLLAVWNYTLGGYQVLKKWLSCREATLLGRPLRVGEVEEFMRIARRIAALLALSPELDACYRIVAALHQPTPDIM